MNNRKYDESTTRFLASDLGAVTSNLAMALIDKFGGEDTLMHHTVMAMPDQFDINSVPEFINDKDLVCLYEEHKADIASVGLSLTKASIYSTPSEFYASPGGLAEWSSNQVLSVMHEPKSSLYSLVTSEIVRITAQHFIGLWLAFVQHEDDFGEILFCTNNL